MMERGVGRETPIEETDRGVAESFSAGNGFETVGDETSTPGTEIEEREPIIPPPVSESTAEPIASGQREPTSFYEIPPPTDPLGIQAKMGEIFVTEEEPNE